MRLVTKNLAKDPARRPQTSSEVWATLEALRDRFARRRPWLGAAVRRVWPATARGRAFALGVIGATTVLAAATSYYWPLRGSPVPVEVYDRYVYGRERCEDYGPVAVPDGIDALQDVVEREPAFAPAHAQLAHCLTLKANLSVEQAGPPLALAKHHAAEAIRLDKDLGLAHAASTLVKLMLERDWAGADASSLKAIQTDPYSAVSWNARGAYQVAIGDYDGAVASFRQAERLNPRSPFDAVNHGWSLIVAGRPGEAVEQHRQTIQRHPDFAFARMELAWALLAAGRVEDARASTIEVRTRLPAGRAAAVDVWLNRIEYVAGDAVRARRLADEWAERATRQWLDPYLIAKLYAGVDDTDAAIGWLERATTERSTRLWMLNTWVHMHPKVAGDARFRNIRRRLKLPDPTAADAAGT